ncbi:MAG: DUF4177 domain-containing protein [Pirellulales bacterium]|nr:DUF4177 domain-containing protein [Pirellulales bacterium]
MKKWEYKIVDSKDVAGGGIFKGKDRSEVDKYLNDLGEKGWEIVNLDRQASYGSRDIWARRDVF